MEKPLFVFMFFIISNIIIAQTPLKVDAGKNTNYCFSQFTGSYINIGGKPTATGGIAPYKYSWELYSKTTKKKLTFLVDSSKNTLSNFELTPTINFMNDYYIFKITVTDSNHTSVSDSCQIGISFFRNTTKAHTVQFISDSVTLAICSTFGGIPPYSYYWTPITGVSNPYIANPNVMPRIDTAHQNYEDFHAEITDAIGCKNIDNGTRVYVIPTGIEEINNYKIKSSNPVSNLGTMNVTSELLGSTLKIVSANGKVQYQTKVETETIPLGSVLPLAGVYFYTVTTPLGKVISGSFVRE